MSQIWLTSDHHFGHLTMLQHRSFECLHDMHEELIDTHNRHVKAGDRVYFLGDLFFNNRVGEIDQSAILGRLNGQKWLICGNHDWIEKWPDSTLDSFVKHTYRHRLVVKGKGVKGITLRMVLSHEPYLTWSGKSYGVLNAHGHCHGKKPATPGQVDVGVDCAKSLWGEMRPFRIEEAAQLATFHTSEVRENGV